MLSFEYSSNAILLLASYFLKVNKKKARITTLKDTL